MMLKLFKIPLFAIILLLATIICSSSFAFDPNFDFWITIDGPNHVLPNQQGIIYTATTHNPEGTCTYSWAGGGNTFEYNAGASGHKDLSCTVKDILNNIVVNNKTKTKTIKICNVTSVTTTDNKTAIMKGGSENITITANLFCILPAGGQIEWQRKFNDGSWTAISGNGTSITLANSESVGKYKYRARVSANTSSAAWKESGDLIVYDIRIKRGDDDITDDTTEVWVGEKISLTFEILPEDSGITLENNHWYIPESRIKNYTFTENEGEIEELTDYDLQENSIDFYWVNGAVGGKIKEVGFVNLDGVDIVQTANFLVKRPELVFRFGSYTADPAMLCINTVYGLWKGNNGPYNGFIIYIETKNNIGDITWAQVIEYSCLERWYHNFWGLPCYGDEIYSDGLDNGFTHARCFYDSPGRGIVNADYQVGVETRFYLCYMFKPPVNEAIYVPLWCCNWQWDSGASGQENKVNWNINHYIDGYSVKQNNINESDVPEWDHPISN